MRCPFCHYHDTKVTDSRLVGEGDQIRRRRECLVCAERFTTYETLEISFPNIVKRNGARQAFNVDKLREGMMKALEKRPVSSEQVEQAIRAILHKMRTQGEREIPFFVLGKWVLEQLKLLDQVAYIRFASVYLRFEDLQSFRDEIDTLLSGGREA